MNNTKTIKAYSWQLASRNLEENIKRPSIIELPGGTGMSFMSVLATEIDKND